MVGKWHLGKSPEHIPAARGFERDFCSARRGGQLLGHDEFYGRFSAVLVFTEDGRYLTRLPKDYYQRRPTPTS